MKLALAVLTLVILGVLVFWFTHASDTPISVPTLDTGSTVEANSPGSLETGDVESRERTIATESPEPASLSPARTVQIVIQSLARGKSKARDLAGVAFALGTSQPDEFSRDYLLQAETDSLGEYRCELELPPLEAGAHLFLRTLEPGYMQNVTWAKLRGDRYEYVIFLRVERGCTIRGRVINQQGEPEPGTRVIFRFEDPKQRPFPSGWFARADSRGRFELHNRFEGRGFIRARKRGVGNALLDDFDFLQACNQDEELELKLAGSGVLAGRVITPDGLTIDHLTVEVRMLGSGAAQATNDTAHTGLGLVAAQTGTDENGAFRITGLEPGTFEFLIHGSGYFWERLPIPPVETDREDIELVVQAHRLEITVVEHDGTPAKKVGWFQSDGQDNAPAINCSWKQTKDLVPIWKGMHPDTSRGQTQIFPAKPGRTLSFAAFSLAGRTEYQEVTFGETDWLIERTLRLPPPRAPGTLALTLESSDGGEFAFMVITVTDNSGTQVHRSLVSETLSRSLSMPPAKLAAGNYTLTARAASAYRYDLARAAFELEPGEHVELSLVAQRGGLLELTVTAEEAPRDPELAALYAESSSWGRARIWPNIVGASLKDMSAEHPNLSVHISNHEDHASWIPLGNTALIDHALPPGDHLIEVRYPGYIPALVPVTIQVGTPSRATAALVPL